MIYTPFSVTLGLFPFIVFGPAFLFLDIYSVCLYWVVRGSERVGFSSDVCDLYTGGASFKPRSRHRLSSPPPPFFAHSHHTDARVVYYGCEDRLLVGYF